MPDTNGLRDWLRDQARYERELAASLVGGQRNRAFDLADDMDRWAEALTATPAGVGVEKSGNDAPVWYGANEADAWANGYNDALASLATSEAPAGPAVGEPSGEDVERDWSEFEDDISDAISDSIDMDWTSRDGARAVVRLLNKLEADRK